MHTDWIRNSMDGVNTKLDKAEEIFGVLDWRKNQSKAGVRKKKETDFSDIDDRKIWSNVCLIEDLERKIQRNNRREAEQKEWETSWLFFNMIKDKNSTLRAPKYITSNWKPKTNRGSWNWWGRKINYLPKTGPMTDSWHSNRTWKEVCVPSI